MSCVSTKKAPAAIGPYSQGISANGCVVVSGQLPINPSTGTIAEGSIKDRTIQSMMNIGEILKEAGSGLDKVVKTTIFVTNLELFGEVNEAYGTFFGGNAPARACVQVAALPKGADIEIEAIATV